MNILEVEIINLTIDLLNNNCVGCLENWPSQKDHSCLSELYFNWSLEEAISFVKEKYEIVEDLTVLFEKLSIK